MVKVSDLWCWAGGDASLGAQLTVLLFVTAIHHTSRCHDVTMSRCHEAASTRTQNRKCTFLEGLTASPAAVSRDVSHHFEISFLI